MLLNSIECKPFTRDEFIDRVKQRLNIPATEKWKPVRQVTYLADYLNDAEISAKTLVFERHYVDRHFMAEYGLYYAQCLQAPSNICSRLHLFDQLYTQDQFDEFLTLNQDVEKLHNLQNSYLGFVVLRPLRETPIGRTILRNYPPGTGGAGRRMFLTSISRNVHLGGIKLVAKGVPFQQQDQRVGACATTAIWCSLAKVTDADGGRSPTPSQITEAAVRYYLSSRAYPSGGLLIEQMCEAMRSLNTSPEVVPLTRPGKPDEAKQLLRAYLRSKIPPILALYPLREASIKGSKVPQVQNGSGHAVTVVGHREVSGSSTCKVILPAAASYERIYVHDDRHGPSKRAYLKNGTWATLDERMERGLLVEIESEIWLAMQIIAPLYPKIRASIVELFEIATAWRNLIIQRLGLDHARVHFDARFTHGADYLTEIRRGERATLSRDLTLQLAKKAVLSRYVGIVEIYYDQMPFIDLVWDATDRIRYEPEYVDAMLAAVCFNDHHRAQAVKFLTDLGRLAV